MPIDKACQSEECRFEFFLRYVIYRNTFIFAFFQQSEQFPFQRLFFLLRFYLVEMWSRCKDNHVMASIFQGCCNIAVQIPGRDSVGVEGDAVY